MKIGINRIRQGSWNWNCLFFFATITISQIYQSTAQPFSFRNVSQAALRARFGLKSFSVSGSLVRGSVGERLR